MNRSSPVYPFHGRWFEFNSTDINGSISDEKRKRGESANAKLASVQCSMLLVLKLAQTLCRLKLNKRYRISLNIEPNSRMRERLETRAKVDERIENMSRVERTLALSREQ